MKDSERRLGHAVRLTPAEEHGRYRAGWGADLDRSGDLAVAPGGVLRGAPRAVVLRRLRQVEGVLLGYRGAPAAVASWAALLLVLVATFVVGGVMLPVTLVVVVALVVVLAGAGTPSHWSHWSMVVSAVTGTASAWFVSWAVDASVTAADDFTPEPALVSWTGPALVVAALGFVGLVVSAAVAVARERRR